MLIVTTNDVPGRVVEEVLGEVFGLTVRSRHIGSQIGASFKSLVGGEPRRDDEDARRGATGGSRSPRRRGRAEGRERDPRDAVRHLRAGSDVEPICAYGTAVRLRR